MNDFNVFLDPHRFFFCPNQSDAKASLYIVSSNNSSLKHLRLQNFSSENRDDLQKWGKENRFIFVVEVGNKIFAHMHKDYAQHEQLLKDPIFEKKCVSIHTLSDEEAAMLADQIHAMVEKILETELKPDKKENIRPKENKILLKDPNGVSLSKSDSHSSANQHNIILKFKNKLAELTLNLIRKQNEERRESAKEDDKRDLEKKIIKDEIAHDYLKRDIIDTDVERHQQQQSG